eukprot:767108-Hanusia_phi.AAC.13
MRRVTYHREDQTESPVVTKVSEQAIRQLRHQVSAHRQDQKQQDKIQQARRDEPWEAEGCKKDVERWAQEKEETKKAGC